MPTAIPSVSAGSANAIVRAATCVQPRERGARTTEDRALAALQSPFLPQVERRKRGGERETRESCEHQPDVQHEEEVRVVAPTADPGSAADPREDEQQDGEGRTASPSRR